MIVFARVVVFFLRLVCPMLPEYLVCPFLIAPSVFSNVYLLKGDYVLVYDLNFGA